MLEFFVANDSPSFFITLFHHSLHQQPTKQIILAGRKKRVKLMLTQARLL
jgi:hypothetical protein